MQFKSVKAFLAVGTAMVLSHPALAIAQDAAPQASEAEASNPADIVVTARRTEERLQDVPISITVFNQQQLADRNITKAEDLAIYTPSLSQNNTLGSTQSSFAIRGFVQDIGTAPSVGVYFADVVAPLGASNNQPVGNGAGPGAFFDLQNVQVLKGPQGTLFGRNTTGGAILLVPQKPTYNLEGYVEGSLGNYDMRRIQAVLNIPIVDTMRFRIGVDKQKRDGYLKNYSGIGPSAYDDQNYTAVRASLVGDLTPDLENYLIASYTQVDQVGDVQKLIDAQVPANPIAALQEPLAISGANQLARFAAAGAGFYSTEVNLPNSNVKQDTWQLINTTTWKASDKLTVKNIASYAELTLDTRSPIFGISGNAAELNPYLRQLGLPFDFFASQQLGPVASLPAPGAKTAQQSTFTEELQFQGTGFDDRLTWQGGGFLSISDPLGLAGSYATIQLDCPNEPTVCANPLLGLQRFLGNTSSVSPAASRTVSKNWFRTEALYAQATYDLSDQFKLTGGFRYTWDSVRSDGQLQSFVYEPSRIPSPPPFAFAPTAPVSMYCTDPSLSLADGCRLQVEQKSSAPTWLIDLDYKPIEDVLLYAKWARGYRAGGIAPQAPVQINTFDPEKVDAYEVGLKTSFRGAVHGTFNIAGFYNDFSNQQLLLSFTRAGNVAGTTSIANAGTSRIAGIEVEGSISPFEGFNINGGYTYLDTEIKSFTPPPAIPNVTFSTPIVPGDPLALSPKHKLSVTAAYTLPLDEKVGQITLAATYSYQSDMVSGYNSRNAAGDVIFPSTVPARSLLDLNLNWKNVGNMPVDLAVFANNVTNEHYYNITLDNMASSGVVTGSVGLPRMYGVRLRVRYGS
jgi:iron complex outermembrane receptor protein